MEINDCSRAGRHQDRAEEEGKLKHTRCEIIFQMGLNEIKPRLYDDSIIYLQLIGR